VAHETDAAEDVYFEEAQPVGIGDFRKGLGLEDPEIVD
jgi:hypothetical protein